MFLKVEMDPLHLFGLHILTAALERFHTLTRILCISRYEKGESVLELAVKSTL